MPKGSFLGASTRKYLSERITYRTSVDGEPKLEHDLLHPYLIQVRDAKGAVDASLDF
jgi:hypothetical protein